jgi:hypothetical protein
MANSTLRSPFFAPRISAHFSRSSPGTMYQIYAFTSLALAESGVKKRHLGRMLHSIFILFIYHYVFSSVQFYENHV